MKHIFIVNTCDSWKSFSSMQKEIVTTSFYKVLDFAGKHLDKDDYSMCERYADVKNYTALSMSERVNILNSILPNIYIEIWND